MRKRDDCKKEESFDTNRNKEELGQDPAFAKANKTIMKYILEK